MDEAEERLWEVETAEVLLPIELDKVLLAEILSGTGGIGLTRAGIAWWRAFRSVDSSVLAMVGGSSKNWERAVTEWWLKGPQTA